MRHLKLVRESYNNWGIYSHLLDENEVVIAVTLEHAYPNTTGGFDPKLPKGTYDCILGPHTLHSGPARLYEITNVPGHKGILFHKGNWNRDSDGCVLLGTKQGNECIENSTGAFGKFMILMDGKNFTLTVT